MVERMRNDTHVMLIKLLLTSYRIGLLEVYFAKTSQHVRSTNSHMCDGKTFSLLYIHITKLFYTITWEKRKTKIEVGKVNRGSERVNLQTVKLIELLSIAD